MLYDELETVLIVNILYCTSHPLMLPFSPCSFLFMIFPWLTSKVSLFVLCAELCNAMLISCCNWSACQYHAPTQIQLQNFLSAYRFYLTEIIKVVETLAACLDST